MNKIDSLKQEVRRLSGKLQDKKRELKLLTHPNSKKYQDYVDKYLLDRGFKLEGIHYRNDKYSFKIENSIYSNNVFQVLGSVSTKRFYQELDLDWSEDTFRNVLNEIDFRINVELAISFPIQPK